MQWIDFNSDTKHNCLFLSGIKEQLSTKQTLNCFQSIHSESIAVQMNEIFLVQILSRQTTMYTLLEITFYVIIKEFTIDYDNIKYDI